MARQAPTFSTVRSEGGLLPADLLQRIVETDRDLGGFDAADYRLGERDQVREAISRAWSHAKAFWAAFQAATEDLPTDATGVTETREQWVLPLLRTLGYRPEFRAAAEEIEGRRYPISHRAGPVPIHIVSFREPFGEGADEPRRGADARRVRPHALLQEYLNRSEGALYGIVTNGCILRLLRDNHSLTRLAYLEFDLKAMLDGGVYADFVLLWLALHRTRLPQAEVEASACWLERWRDRAATQGTRAMGELRKGVEKALEALGTGLLAHPANEALRTRLRSGELSEDAFYAQLLRLLYRLLFLFVAEERDLLFATDLDTTERARLRDRYDRFYSVSRLRDIARRYADDDRHEDLWRGLALVFDVLAGRREGLGLASLSGGLFAAEACPDIDGGARISNAALAQAISYLSVVMVADRSRRGGRPLPRRVNYRDMDVEELGGVYEGLLERRPSVVAETANPHFKLVGSGERKQTGSYYTPSSLVQELVRSALDPVIADRLKGTRTAEERVAALLGITVCDTAAGSGHFLLAAARRIADHLARAKAGDREPEPTELRSALRDVIRSCIYGVDLNPLAVDLCRLALWLEGHEAGRPLTFLDHRIKVGNSLIGTTPELVAEGIPDGAFERGTGEEKKLAAALKKRNKAQRAGQRDMFSGSAADWGAVRAALARETEAIGALPEDAPSQVAEQRERYEAYRRERFESARAALDAWTAAFFWPLPSSGAIEPPLSAALYVPAGVRPALSAAQRAEIERLRDEHRFFHWPLEFPEVFERGGFDCVLGNPPWDRIKLQEQEFFAERDAEIAKAPNAAARKKLIAALPTTNPPLAAAFNAALRRAEGSSLFVRASGRFPLSAVGDVNLYPLFAELDCAVIKSRGRAGVIVPTGLATDNSTKQFFQHLVDSKTLVSYFGFKNEEHLFPKPVEHTVTFGLLTVVGSGPHVAPMEFTWFAYNTAHMNDPARRVTLSRDDLVLLNPNTRTCPIFRTRADADLTREIYRRVPVLVNEVSSTNPWGARLLRVFDMNKREVADATKTREQLESEELSKLGEEVPVAVDRLYLPVMEAKLMNQYNHRFATYDGCTPDERRRGLPRELDVTAWSDPSFRPLPRYWLPSEAYPAALAFVRDLDWLLGYRNFARSTDERTVIAAILPRSATDFPMRIMTTGRTPGESCSLLANLNSLVLDYVGRQKVGGTDLSSFIVKQLPVLPPSAYTETDLSFIVSRALELTYTAWDLKPFAEDLGYDGPPYRWDEERRAVLRAELDAYYAALYGLTRNELRYVLDPSDVYGPDFPGETFRVLKNNELRRFGEYRTQRLVLDAWDRLGMEPRNRDGRYDPTTEAPTQPAPPDEAGLVPAAPMPVVISSRTDGAAAPYVSALLEYAVENRFPHPIARAFYQLRQTTEPAAEATQLANIVGVTLEYLALVSLASYLAGDRRDTALDDMIRKTLARPVSHGGWAGLLRESLRTLRDGSVAAFMDELSDSYLPKPGDPKGTDLKTLTDDLVILRNSVMKRTAGEPPPASLVRDLKQALLRAFQALGFVADYPLVAARSTTVSQGIKVHQCRLLSGFSDTFDQTTVQCDLDLERDRPALLKPRTGELLYLDPLFVLRQCPTDGCDRIHLFALEQVGSREVEYVAAGGHRLKNRPAAATFDSLLRYPGTMAQRGQAQHLYLGTDAHATDGELPRGHRVGGKYELVRRLGHGGMADVYEALRLSDGTPVALKLFPPQLLANQALVTRFRGEAAQARELDHPNVVTVLDHGQGLFELYLVMPLAQGWHKPDATVALDAGQLDRPLGPDVAVDIARQVCEALEAVHQHGIVHRDVKPSNLLLFADKQVKLADFGIARARDQIALTMTGIPLGTPEYMSPEQAEGSRELTPASDIYSLGVVLYELLTGQNPFKRSAPLATMSAQATVTPPPPSSMNPAVPQNLDAMVLKCLKKKPEERYRSAGDLYRALASVALVQHAGSDA